MDGVNSPSFFNMKKIFIIVLLVIFGELFSNVNVHFKNTKINSKIVTKKFDKIDYFNIYELNKVFHAHIMEEFLDQRININLYNHQFIILMNSSLLLANDKIYNFKYPMKFTDGKYYLPTEFFKELNYLLDSKIFAYKNKKIKAKFPYDNSIKTIVIDPGHGGKDPGALGYRRTREKDIALILAKKVKKIMKKELPDVTILLTRSTDKFVSLQSRTKFANSKHADLFVSIHCNASKSRKANGTEVYFLSTAKTTEARAVESLENSVVFKYEGGKKAQKNYDNLAFILMDMAQNEQLEESSQLAMILQKSISKKCRNHSRGVKQAGFYVLKGAYMPAVLIETGFISNPKEEKKLNNPQYQDKMAASIVSGIKNFKYLYDGFFK